MNENINLNKALDFLLQEAYKRHISKRKMCEGVYDYSQFVHICNGNRTPTLNLIIGICENLDIPFSMVMDFTMKNEYKKMVLLKNKLLECYFKDEDIIKKVLEEDNATDNIYLRQLIETVKGISFLKIEEKYDIARNQFMQAIQLTNQAFDLESQKYQFLNDNEMFILQFIINTYIKEANIETANQIIQKIENKCSDEYVDLMSSYNYLCKFENEMNWDKAIYLGQELIQKNQNSNKEYMNLEVYKYLCNAFIHKKDYPSYNKYKELALSHMKIFKVCNIQFEKEFDQMEKQYKNRKLIRITKIASVFIILIIIGGSIVTGYRPKKLDMVQCEREIKEILEERASLMIDDSKLIVENIYSNENQNEIEQKMRMDIVEHREYLKDCSIIYNQYESNIEVYQTTFKKNEAFIKVKEETLLYEADSKTGYLAEHQFIYSYLNGKWILVKDQQLEPTGLLSLPKAKEYCE